MKIGCAVMKKLALACALVSCASFSWLALAQQKPDMIYKDRAKVLGTDFLAIQAAPPEFGRRTGGSVEPYEIWVDRVTATSDNRTVLQASFVDPNRPAECSARRPICARSRSSSVPMASRFSVIAIRGDRAPWSGVGAVGK
jgi:hypothetical protein